MLSSCADGARSAEPCREGRIRSLAAEPRRGATKTQEAAALLCSRGGRPATGPHVIFWRRLAGSKRMRNRTSSEGRRWKRTVLVALVGSEWSCGLYPQMASPAVSSSSASSTERTCRCKRQGPVGLLEASRWAPPLTAPRKREHAPGTSSFAAGSACVFLASNPRWNKKPTMSDRRGPHSRPAPFRTRKMCAMRPCRR